MAGACVVPLGRLVTTRAVNEAVAEHLGFAEFTVEAIRRHASGDWGELEPEDWKENEHSLGRHLRLLSSYPLPEGLAAAIGAPDDRLWIITEADRSATTLLWPSDY